MQSLLNREKIMEKIKERDERTVKLEQIAAVTACLSTHTLRVYLNNFCFEPFKRVVFDNPRKHFEYVYQKENHSFYHPPCNIIYLSF